MAQFKWPRLKIGIIETIEESGENRERTESQREDLNLRPADYERTALVG
jgi:hypothetical protein